MDYVEIVLGEVLTFEDYLAGAKEHRLRYDFLFEKLFEHLCRDKLEHRRK